VQEGNGNVYITGGVATSWSANNNPFTNIAQQEILTLKNTSNQSSALITNVIFSNGANSIHSVAASNDQCTGKSLAPKDSCAVIYTSQVLSYGSDTITATYTIDGNVQTVKTAPLSVKPPTITLLQPSGTAISNGSFINLKTNTTAQTYTITTAPFAWQNASVTLQNPPTNDTTPSSFFTTNCNGLVMPSSPCTIKFNTSITAAPSIATLNFDPKTIILQVSGNNLDSTYSWPLTPVVGEYMQGGVVFWVGTDSTKPGYRQTLVAAVSDLGSLQWKSGEYVYIDVILTGLFQGPNGEATGLVNTNAILAKSGIGYPAARAAQNYQVGSFSGWYLPAAAPEKVGTCQLGIGEMCEVFLLSNIIDATAIQHGGRPLKIPDYYWTSTEAEGDPSKAWTLYTITVTGHSGVLWPLNKDMTALVRPIRTFTYWNN
jgi:hypothetical protein